MDALAAYGSDSDAEDHDEQLLTSGSTALLDHDLTDAFGLNGLKAQSSADPVASATIRSEGTNAASSSALTLAPKVIDNSSAAEAMMLRPGDTTMHVNVPYRDMVAPQHGPENPFTTHQQRQLGAQQNSLSGHVENVTVSDFDFRNQQRTFDVYGYAQDPTLIAGSSSGASVGDQNAAALYGGASALDIRSGQGRFKTATRQLKKQRKGKDGDPSVVEGDGAYLGPWAKWETESAGGAAEDAMGATINQLGPTAAEQAAAEALAEKRVRDKQAAEAYRAKNDATAESAEHGSEKSVFHGKSMYDYQGRTYMHVPTDVDVNLSGEAGEQECYLPKSCIHTFKGHSKGISTLKLLPASGHLLLSASLDTTVKLWDLYHEGRPCLRTFMGHSKAIRDVSFSNDGRKFLSAGYDRQIKLWDTETGVCLSTFSIAKIPYCVTFHPDQDKQHIFLTGTSDKKALQYDSNTGEITQEYSQHLGAVNTITFVDQNRRFVTTSDDKVMRGWDYDIPVVIKYVSDPTMHSMPAVTVSPNAKWLACQSMDNQILTFATDGFKQNRKKVFRGHNVAGFACQPAFSPDGKFLSSGDSEGNLVFWDWKSTKLLKRIRHAHSEPIISHAWLPHESSKVVTGSWDGLIKLWD